MKSKQEYIKELTEAIEKTELQIEAIDKLLPVMKSLNGKNIRQQKYIKNKLAEVLPDFSINFHEKYSWYEITVMKWLKSGCTTLLQINCGYIGEVEYFDFDLITGAKERKTGGVLGNNYYFGTDKQYSYIQTELVKFEKQLQNVNNDYKTYQELHEKIKAFNVPFLSIELRR